MKREYLNCRKKLITHAVRDVPYTYRGSHTVVSNISGWHCQNCGEVEFDEGERYSGVEFVRHIGVPVLRCQGGGHRRSA